MVSSANGKRRMTSDHAAAIVLFAGFVGLILGFTRVSMPFSVVSILMAVVWLGMLSWRITDWMSAKNWLVWGWLPTVAALGLFWATQHAGKGIWDHLATVF